MTKVKEEITPICGIVMPISAIDGCSESHWNDVMGILNDCIEEAGFEPNIVSNADDIGVIQKRIIQNLYDNPVVICDVSGKSTLEKINEKLDSILSIPNVESAEIETIAPNHHHIDLIISENADRDYIRSEVKKLTRTPLKRKTTA